MSHVFISYSSKDAEYANKLAEELKRRPDLKVWMDYQRLPFNEAFFPQISEAIRECGAFVVLMSPNSAKSRWVRKEMHLADKIGKPIFPILLAGEEFDFLVDYTYTDCLNGNLPSERWYDEIAANCSLNPNHKRQDVTSNEIYSTHLVLTAEEYFELGNLASDQNNHEDAIKYYSYAIQLNPQFFRAYINIGDSYNKIGDNKNAIKNYTYALQINPHDAIAFYNRGNIYLDMKNYEAAIIDYKFFILLEPQFALAYNNRGVAYKNLGKDADAIKDYKYAIELDPKLGIAHWNLGNIYYEQKQFADALANYCQYLALAGNDDSSEVLKRVAELGGCLE